MRNETIYQQLKKIANRNSQILRKLWEIFDKYPKKIIIFKILRLRFVIISNKCFLIEWFIRNKLQNIDKYRNFFYHPVFFYPKNIPTIPNKKKMIFQTLRSHPWGQWQLHLSGFGQKVISPWQHNALPFCQRWDILSVRVKEETFILCPSFSFWISIFFSIYFLLNKLIRKFF